MAIFNSYVKLPEGTNDTPLPLALPLRTHCPPGAFVAGITAVGHGKSVAEPAQR